MDSSVKSYQNFASEILEINLPETSTSFSLFQNGKEEIVSPKIAKKQKRNNKLRNFTHEIRVIEKLKRPSVPAYGQKLMPKFKRSMTTIMNKTVNKIMLANRLKPKSNKDEKYFFPIVNPILFKLNAKLRPKECRYNIKQLKNQTLVYKADTGLLRYSIDPTSPTKPKCLLRKPGQSAQESSDQLLLSTENSLSDFYAQSIRLQNLIRRREQDNKIDAHQYETLSNKLFSINQSITNEQSRIALSFYSL